MLQPKDIRAKSSPNKVALLIVVAVVIAALATSGWLVYQHRATSSGTTPPTATRYLNINEWGIRLPLSHGITDAYYVVSTSSQDPVTGTPNTMWLGLTSLDHKGCDASSANQGLDTQLGAIVRVLPTDADPIDGVPYTKLYPGGVTIGKYYYAYSSGTSKRPCASFATLQSIDTAFSVAIRDAVASAPK